MERALSKDGPNSLLFVDFQFLFKHIDVVSKAMIIDLDAHQVTIIFFCQTIKHCSVCSNFIAVFKPGSHMWHKCKCKKIHVWYVSRQMQRQGPTQEMEKVLFLVLAFALAFAFQTFEPRQSRHKCKCTGAGLAQSVEHLTAEQKVAGAIPWANT